MIEPTINVKRIIENDLNCLIAIPIQIIARKITNEEDIMRLGVNP